MQRGKTQGTERQRPFGLRDKVGYLFGDIKCGRRVQAPVSRPQKEEILKGVS